MKLPAAVYVAPTFSVPSGTAPTTGATLVTFTVERGRIGEAVVVGHRHAHRERAVLREGVRTETPLPVLPSPKSQA